MEFTLYTLQLKKKTKKKKLEWRTNFNALQNIKTTFESKHCKQKQLDTMIKYWNVEDMNDNTILIFHKFFTRWSMVHETLKVDTGRSDGLLTMAKKIYANRKKRNIARHQTETFQ